MKRIRGADKSVKMRLSDKGVLFVDSNTLVESKIFKQQLNASEKIREKQRLITRLSLKRSYL